MHCGVEKLLKYQANLTMSGLYHYSPSFCLPEPNKAYLSILVIKQGPPCSSTQKKKKKVKATSSIN